MAPERKSVALVIPVFNEEDVLPRLISEIESFRETRPFIDQVVLIDDGSSDRTSVLARRLTEDKPGYVIIRFSRNFGHQLAVTAGMHFVDRDAAVILDADLQDPLHVIDAMVEKWREGFDVVYGVRRARERDTWGQRITAKLFYRTFQRMTDVEAPLDAGDFRLVSKNVLTAYRSFQEQQPYVRGLVSWLGFNQTGVEYDRPARAAGSPKYRWKDRFRLATHGIASFSGRPLRYAVRLGLAVSLFSVVGLVWVVLARYVFGNTVPGWSSILFSAFFFGGLQMFFLGVVGSYLARVYDEVKARPRYVIRDTWKSTDE